jgi:DNA replication protein DnaC
MSLQTIVKEILSEYQKQSLQNAREFDNKTRLIYSKIPKLKEIDSELNKTAIQIIKLTLSTSSVDIDTEIEKIKQKNLDLQMEKTELLVSNGFSQDFLLPTYNCPKCKDTGYINNLKCTCLQQKIINKLYEQSNLKNTLKKENFDNFDFSLYSKEIKNGVEISQLYNMQMNYKECSDFVHNFDTTAKDLLMIGETGLGKTFLCNCIAKDLLDRGKLVLYQTSPDLFSVIEKHKFTNFNDLNFALLQSKVDLIYSCDLLIIDDLGTEISSSIINTSLFNIINSRMLSNKRTIISTNFSLNDIFDNYSKRISSRLIGNYTTLRFLGDESDDIRLKMRKRQSF